MANSETTLIRVDTDAKDRLMDAGSAITHNPNLSANDAVIAVLGELEALQKRVRDLERAMLRPAPVAA